jgi:DNA polymerase-3 subunit alpha
MPEPEPEHPQGEPTQNEGEAEDRVAEEVRKSIPNLDLFDQKQSEHPPRLITVAVKPNGSMERDKRRLKNIHGVLISFPGKDKFSLQIFEGEKGHLIDFPNYNTRICDEMLARLKTVLGSEDWRIEEIVN